MAVSEIDEYEGLSWYFCCGGCFIRGMPLVSEGPFATVQHDCYGNSDGPLYDSSCGLPQTFISDDQRL